MKTLFAVLMSLALSGCVTATYHHDAQSEDFHLTSVMKKVDGLKASRKGSDFVITADKTGGDTEALLQMQSMLFDTMMKMMASGAVK